MRKTMMLAAMAAATALSTPAFAGSAEGNWQIKVLGTAVLPDGKLTEVNGGTPGALDTRANDNIVPTLAVEYFVTPNVSIETICCLTQHDVDGAGALAGSEMVADAKILPATLTLKYHFNAGSGIKPYIGAGPTYFIFIDEKPGAATVSGGGLSMAATRMRLNDKLGFVLQAGVDIPVNDSGLSISLDAKRYFLRTSSHWFNAAGTEILSGRHRLDPWVLSAGVGFRF